MKLIPISEFLLKYLEYSLPGGEIISLNSIFSYIETYHGANNENFKKKFLTTHDVFQKTLGIEGDAYQKKLNSTIFVLKVLEKFMEFRNILIEHDIILHLVNGSNCDIRSSSLLVIDEDYAELFHNRFDVYSEKKVLVEEDQVNAVFEKIRQDAEDSFKKTSSHSLPPEQESIIDNVQNVPIVNAWIKIAYEEGFLIKENYPNLKDYNDDGSVSAYLKARYLLSNFKSSNSMLVALKSLLFPKKTKKDE